MKHYITATLTALSLGMVTITVQAQEPVSESAMMLYYNMPFGGKSRKQETPTYGFRMGTLERSDSNFDNLNGKPAPALVDFAMNQDGAQALSFNGVNVLKKITVYNANGTGSTTTTIDWGLVVIGIAGVGILTMNNDCTPAPNLGMVYGVAIDPCAPQTAR